MDEAIFRWINGWPDWPAPIFVFLSDATKMTPGRVLLGLVALGVLMAGNATRKALFLGLLSVGIANEITDVLKGTFQMARPCVELEDVLLRVGKLTSFGTASAHSANMAALATIFWLAFRWRGSVWMAVALLTGLSRIYVGVHYPSQVLLGWTCGVLAGVVVWYSWAAWVRLRAGKEPSVEPG